ncbi:hypothetical protein ACN47E_000528 [Coniothyrium glycines]
MRCNHIFFASFSAVAGAQSLHAEDVAFAELLKRQAPGSASYNCHDNCGTAITLSREPNPCGNQAFLTNYENCLQCSGPDNFDIWRMYGRTLSNAGGACGLETEPKSGEQPDVGPAVRASSAAVGASTPFVSAIPSVSANPSASATQGPASNIATSSALSTASSPLASVLPSQSADTSASSTSLSSAEQTVNAAASFEAANAGLLGAFLVGAVFGL